jgi:hypothetical protein
MEPNATETAVPGGELAVASEVPAPTLLTGMLTAVATGALVGWALYPVSTTVAGAPLFAVAAVATTLWAGLAFLRRALPSGVLADGFYLMAVAVLARPAAVAAVTDGPMGLGRTFLTVLVSVVVAGVLGGVGWRLDTRARAIRLRRARRRLRARVSARGRRQKESSSQPAAAGEGKTEVPSPRMTGHADSATVRDRRRP